MKIGKDDWAFKVNTKTNAMEMHMPKRKEYTTEELAHVAVALARFLAPWGMVFNDSQKKKPGKPK